MSRPRRSAPELPHEILVDEILPRVPGSSLVRFKFVCEKWRHLINDPNFIETHLLHHSRSNQQLNVLLTNEGKLYSRIIKTGVSSPIEVACNPLPSNCFETHKHRDPWFWGSCNGLICLQTEEYKLGLWNPCTGSYRALPYYPPPRAITCGFGYDANTKDYKLVKIVSVTQVRVFTLNTNSWRTISDANCPVSAEAPGKFIDGVLYWINLNWINLKEVGPNRLICFDIHDEVFSELRLPDVSPTEEISRIKICDINGCLALARELNCAADIVHEVWVMKENWIKMYSVDVSTTRRWIEIGTVTPLGGINIIEKRNEKKESHVDRVIYMSKEYGWGWRSCFSFNPSTSQFVRFPFPNASYFAKYGSTITYVESLVSVNPEK